MLFRLLLAVPVATFGLYGPAKAESAADSCDSVLVNAANEVDITIRSNEFLNAVFDKNCTSTGQKSSGSIGIPGIINIDGDSSSVSKFCREYKDTRYGNFKYDRYKQRVSSKALETYLECRRAAFLNVSVGHRFVNVEKMYFSIGAPRGRPVEIRGLHAPINVHCQTTLKEKDSLQGKSIFVEKQTILKTADVMTIFCTRDPEKELGDKGQKIFSEAAILLGVSEVGPYSVLWPKDEVSPQTLASQIQLRLGELDQKMSALEAKRFEFILRRSLPANPTTGPSAFVRLGCDEANGESLVAGSCLALEANGEGSGAPAVVGPFLFGQGGWDVGNPIHTVECRSGGHGATALAVCLRVAK
jgi:hypothetical protein